MKELVDYVMNHTERGACQCGKCIDAPPNPKEHQPIGHTADMIFFKVKAKDNPTAETLKNLVKANQKGEFNDVDLFDGKEHGYMELGGWIGSQDLALRLMALGALVGLWGLLTPNILPGIPDVLKMQMAGAGFVTIKYDSTEGKL